MKPKNVIKKQLKNDADISAAAYREKTAQTIKNVQDKLDRGEKLSNAELTELAMHDKELYKQAKDVIDRRETYCLQLLKSEAAETLHRQITETLGRQVARAKKASELKILRWQLMAAQDCYRVFSEERGCLPAAAPLGKDRPADTTISKRTAVPTPQQLAALMRASASDSLYNVKQMDRLMEELSESKEYKNS